jgi:hypothetical protein
MNRTVNTTATAHCAIRGVHYRIDLLLSDVALNGIDDGHQVSIADPPKLISAKSQLGPYPPTRHFPLPESNAVANLCPAIGPVLGMSCR